MMRGPATAVGNRSKPLGGELSPGYLSAGGVRAPAVPLRRRCVNGFRGGDRNAVPLQARSRQSRQLLGLALHCERARWLYPVPSWRYGDA